MIGITNGGIAAGGSGSGSTDTFFTDCTTAANVSVKEVSISNFTKRVGTILVVNFTNGNSNSYIYLKINDSASNDQVIFNTNQLPGNYVTIDPYDQVELMYIGGDLWRIISVSGASSGSGSLGSQVNFYGTYGYSGNTAIALTISGFSLSKGVIVAIYFKYAVPAMSTLNINSTGAKNIRYKRLLLTSDIIQADDTATFLYDGTDYQLISIDRVGSSGGGGSTRTYTKPWYINSSGAVVEETTIQAAIDGCPVHGTVHIPWRGTTYSVSSTIHIAKPITLESDYVGYDHDEMIGYNASYSQASSYTSATNKITNAQMATPLITSSVSDTSAATAGIYIHCIGVTLKNISIQCTGFTRYDSAVIKAKDEFGFVDATTRSDFNRFITLENCVAICYAAHTTNNANDGTYCGRGIWLDSTGLTRILRTEVYGTHNAFYVTGNTTVNTSTLFQNCWAINFTSIGYYLYGAYYCTFIACAADSHAGNFGTDVTIGYYFSSCSGISAVGCGCEKMTIGVALDSCYNVSFGGIVTISKEGTSAQPTMGVQAFTTSKFGLENLFILVSTDAISGQAVTHYYKCAKTPQSKITFINTNIESVYNGSSTVPLNNDGMYDFSA